MGSSLLGLLADLFKKWFETRLSKESTHVYGSGTLKTSIRCYTETEIDQFYQNTNALKPNDLDPKENDAKLRFLDVLIMS